MVAVVCGPAQRQLGKIAGADDEPALLICDVHYDLGALTGLAVFVCHVPDFRVVAYIPEVQLHRLADGYVTQGNAQGGAQPHGVAFCALRCAEAGHGDGDDVLSWLFDKVEGARRDQQGETAVQPSGNSHHGGFGAGVLQTLFQARGLYAEYGLGSGGKLAAAVGDEGIFRHRPRQRRFPHGLAERHTAVPVLRQEREGGLPAPLPAKPVQVYFRAHQLRAAEGRIFRQNGPVFRNDVVLGEHDVLGGFPGPGAAVDVSAQQPRGGGGDQSPAVLSLAYGLV